MEDYQADGASPRVSFGPKEWQSIQPEVASMLLTLWRERQPAQFGSYLAEVLTGTKPRTVKGQLCTSQSFTTAGNGSAPTITWTADTAPGVAPPSTASTASVSTNNGIST